MLCNISMQCCAISTAWWDTHTYFHLIMRHESVPRCCVIIAHAAAAAVRAAAGAAGVAAGAEASAASHFVNMRYYVSQHSMYMCLRVCISA